jgi:hypothetical protein
MVTAGIQGSVCAALLAGEILRRFFPTGFRARLGAECSGCRGSCDPAADADEGLFERVIAAHAKNSERREEEKKAPRDWQSLDLAEPQPEQRPVPKVDPVGVLRDNVADRADSRVPKFPEKR